MNTKAVIRKPHIATLALATAISPLAINVYLPSLPAITRHFETTATAGQLSLSLYLGATALLQLLFGPLSDIYGRRPVMISLLVLMLLATLMCIYAPNIEIFLLGRVLQASAAVGIVLSRAIVRDLVDGAQAASMIAYITMGMTLAPMIGPAIGGFLEESFGWQSSFWLLFAFTLFALLIIFIDLNETNHDRIGGFKEQFRAWPELLTSHRFWGYSLCLAFSSAAFFAFLGAGPLLAVEYYDMRPASFGLYFFFIAFGYMIGNFLAGRYSARIGINRMLMIGNFIVFAGLAPGILTTLAFPSSPLAFFLPVFFIGIGNGITLPNANAGIVSVRPSIAGAASGLGASLQIGGGAAISAMTGFGLSPADGPVPLILFILACIFCAIMCGLYVIHIERLRAASGGI